MGSLLKRWAGGLKPIGGVAGGEVRINREHPLQSPQAHTGTATLLAHDGTLPHFYTGTLAHWWQSGTLAHCYWHTTGTYWHTTTVVVPNIKGTHWHTAEWHTCTLLAHVGTQPLAKCFAE